MDQNENNSKTFYEIKKSLLQIREQYIEAIDEHVKKLEEEFVIMRIQLIIIFIFIALMPLAAQEESANVREGNKLYKSEKFVDAEVAYRKGLQKSFGND